MTTISTTTLDSLIGKTEKAKDKAADTYNQFLQLLTTQLQNQDPLDPMKSEEFTNQLVQFSQVEQAILSNEKLDSLLAQQNANKIGQSLEYIGKSIYYRGDTIFNDGNSQRIGYAIDGKTETSKLRILDEFKQIVRTLEIPKGTTSGNVTWDGKDDQGRIAAKDKNYTVRIDALDAEGKAIPSYTGVPGTVTGVESVDGVLYLALAGDGRIDASNVLSVSERDGG